MTNPAQLLEPDRGHRAVSPFSPSLSSWPSPSPQQAPEMGFRSVSWLCTFFCHHCRTAVGPPHRAWSPGVPVLLRPPRTEDHAPWEQPEEPGETKLPTARARERRPHPFIPVGREQRLLRAIWGKGAGGK